jgi:hypothetical protein
MRIVRARPMVVGSPLAIAYPMVWRTRMLFVLGAGAGAIALTWVVARVAPIATATVPELSTLLRWWSTFEMLAVIGALFVTIQQVRWARPIFSSRARLGLAGCCFLSAATVVLPPHVALFVGLPRLAAVESEATLRADRAFLLAHRFFKCTDAEEIEGNRVRDRILARYGLERRTITTDNLECTTRESEVLWIVRVADVIPAEEAFEAKWKTIEAAHQYASGMGPLASGPRSLLSLAAIAATFAIGAAIMVKPRRPFGFAGTRTWRANIPLLRWYEVAGDRMAARFPALWSSQIHKSVGDALLAIVLITIGSWGNTSASEDLPPLVAAGLIVLMVVSPALLVRRQQCLRTTEPPTLHDAVSFVVHFVWFASLLVLAARISLKDDLFANFFIWVFGLVLLFSACFSTTVSALFQVARRLPTLHVLVGFWIAIALSSGGVSALDTSTVSDRWLIGFLVFVNVAALALSRQRRWPAVGGMSAAAAVSMPAILGAISWDKVGLSVDTYSQVGIVSIVCVVLSVVSALFVRTPVRRLGRILG